MSPDRTDSLDADIDRLYQLPLEKFTAERNALAADLRKAGDRDGAERVKALGKPTVTAWALNQVWWGEQPTFRGMLDAGEELRAAHESLAKGKRVDLREAIDARQQAVDAVVALAVRQLGGDAEVSPEQRHRLAGTSEALASSGVPPGATLGRLTADLQSTGLDVLSALATGKVIGTPVPLGSAPPARPHVVARSASPSAGGRAPAKTVEDRTSEKKAEAARAQAARLSQAKADLASKQASLREAQADAARAASAEKRTRQAHDRAAARVAELEQGLDAAREDEREARRALSEATKAASAAEFTRAQSVRAVDAARRHLDELG
jgi:hypothetical protein